jgi:hypothetical protein
MDAKLLKPLTRIAKPGENSFLWSAPELKQRSGRIWNSPGTAEKLIN